MGEKTLRIGDEANAILLLQNSQSDPRKALAELVENAIDAKARNVHVTRHRAGGEIELLIEDDGEGVSPGPDGNSDMDRVATHICDSMKRRLSDLQKIHVQGEFAVGLLGFGAIGGNLEMVSRTALSPQSAYLRLTARCATYESGLARVHLPGAGTRVRVWPVHPHIAGRITADRLNKYLGEELRERLRETRVELVVEDTVGARKRIVVKPRDYAGERIKSIDKVATPSGNVTFRLFVAQEGDEGQVSIYRRGTKVLDDLTEIAELDHDPWNSPLVEGMIDSRFVSVPPATRRGIVPDQCFRELIDAVTSVEPEVREALRRAEEAREKKLSRDVVKKLRDAFAEVVRELPDEYAWFDAEGRHGMPSAIRPGSFTTKPTPVRISLGPLHRVTITPQVSQVAPNEQRRYVAKAWTAKDELIPFGVAYRWSIDPPGLAMLRPSASECDLLAGPEEADLKLGVTAALAGVEARAFVTVQILAASKKHPQGGFPTPHPVHRPGEGWRSRWNKTLNTLDYNTGHPDYVTAKSRSSKAHLRYLGYLFSKHLVLHNFSQTGEEAVLERMVEVLERLETRL